MSSEEVEIADSHEKVEGILTNLFGAIVESKTIKEIIISCNGNLSNCIEIILKESDSGISISDSKTAYSQKISKPLFDGGLPKHTKTASASNSRQLPKVPQSTVCLNIDSENTTLTNMSPNINAAIERDPELKGIFDSINQNHKVVIILRGLPGSGKSYLAETIIFATNKRKSNIFSADNYFKRSGNYAYDVSKLSDAHTWNQQQFNKFITKGYSPAIVDNTNSEIWEMKFYATMAVANGYILEVLEPHTPWATCVQELSFKNVHGVPLAKIKNMYNKYQLNINGNYLLDYFKLSYRLHQRPPQPATKDDDIASNEYAPIRSSCTPTLHHPRDQGAVCLESIEMKADVVQNVNTDDQVSQEPATSNPWCKLQPTTSTGDDTFTKIGIAEIQNSAENKDISKLLNSLVEIPKPQRSTSSKRQNKSLSLGASLFSQNVDWEPIDLWVCDKNDSKVVIPGISLLSDVETRDVETNTQSSDIDPNNFHKFALLVPFNRDINLFTQESPSKKRSSVFTLDKSTMTYLEEHLLKLAQDTESKIQRLKELQHAFGYAPEDYIRHILENCKGNENWAGEILLDGKNDEGVLNLPKETLEFSINSNAKSDCTITEVPLVEEINEVSSDHSKDQNESIAANTSINDNKHVKLFKKDKPLSEVSSNLKKEMEENFTFRDDLYSNHVLKLKRKIRGEKSPVREPVLETTEEMRFEEPSNDSSSDSESDKHDTIVSVRMGNEFIEQLDDIFGTGVYEVNLEPVIHMPMSLLNQIHALWLESVCNQIDVQKAYLKSIIKEDEEFARQLEVKEKERRSQGMPPEVPNLKEIMDMEVALAMYKSDTAMWKKETPQDLATKLTRQKLIQLFPDVEEQMLLEVFNAFDNNFEQTVQEMLVSTGKIPLNQEEGMAHQYVQNLVSFHEQDLISRAQREKEKITNPQSFEPEHTPKHVEVENKEIDIKTAIEMHRQEANHHLQIRNENHAKAQDYCRRGMTQAATYYSQMAALHTQKHDYANSLAASKIIQAAAVGRDQYTLDLHHLYVAEALQALDLFLDHHISLLRSQSCPSNSNFGPPFVRLFLVTGRGRHSPGGLPRIKPAVKIRLQQRNLRFGEVNSGLLDANVSAYDALSNALANPTAM